LKLENLILEHLSSFIIEIEEYFIVKVLEKKYYVAEGLYRRNTKPNLYCCATLLSTEVGCGIECSDLGSV
jgi:hypothetical protein